MTEEYKSFSKIPRLNREITITEKIDGTASQVFIYDKIIRAGSKNRWLTEHDDNFGFYKWVMENREELLTLGDGAHWGEWYGSGIQRSYGLKEKRWALFNTFKWGLERPACCHVVPQLYQGLFCTHAIEVCLQDLKNFGSRAIPNWTKPEGIIIYHSAANQYFKVTCEKDEKPKGQTE